MNLVAQVVLMFSLMTTTEPSLGEIVEQAPDAREWADTISEVQLREIKAPIFITVVDSFADNDKEKGVPKFHEFNHLECRKVSYLGCMSPVNANFSVMINNANPVRGLTGVFAMTGADSVVYTVPEGLYMSSSDGKSSVQINSKQKDGKFNTRDFAESIITSLGYDGVVLAVKEDFALVGSTENRLKRLNLQGLALADSHKKWSLAKLRKKGATLLSLVNASGPYGVFRIVVGDKDKEVLQVGSKIILESK